uniref:7TM_GPCR_Srx domain-containing protein n=1 Tax=Parastrongyloides trichosuri TaxID=131310 RepID=A0A0N4ZK05_PARTI
MDLFVFKVGYYLPFVYLDMSYLQLGINLFISLISYSLYILIIYVIFVIQKSDSTYKSVFYKVTIILGIVEIFGHLMQFFVFYQVRISPLVDYFAKHSPPAWQFTVIINCQGFGLVGQGAYSLYLSLIRFVAVYFPLKSQMLQERTYNLLHIFIFFACCTEILLSPIYYGSYMVDPEELKYTLNKSTGTFQSKSLFLDRSNRHLYTTLLTGAFTVIAVVSNVFTYIKFNKTKVNSSMEKSSQMIQRKNEQNMNRFVILLTTKQFLFLLFNILQAWKPKINTYDNSIYNITQGIKPWVQHINFFFSAYAMIYFNKKIREKIIGLILHTKSNRTETQTAFHATQTTAFRKPTTKIIPQ